MHAHLTVWLHIGRKDSAIFLVIFHVFGILFKRISIDAGHMLFFHSSSIEKKSIDYFASPECDQMAFFGDKIAQFSNSMGGLSVGRAFMKMVPLKSARKTAHATMFVQKYFRICYGLLNMHSPPIVKTKIREQHETVFLS